MIRSGIALAGAIALFAQAELARAQETTRPETGTLVQIEAEGTVRVTPDIMTIYASVVTTGSTAAEALDGNNALAGRLIQAVRASGIAITSLQTSNLDVDPRFAGGNRDDRDDQAIPPQILGYIARNTLNVELADVAQAGNLISLMFEAGANAIGGPTFSVRDSMPARRRAEQAALLEARAEAENYAAALNMRVARVLWVSDKGFRDGSGSSIIVMGSRIQPTPIEPGEVTFAAKVFVEYLLEPR